MTAFHFGDADAPLVGVLHPSDRRHSDVVLVCPPLGVESIQSHRVVRMLAERLADAGWSTLRFDYRGSGDSSGDESILSRASMARDAREALDEVLDATGARRALVIGVRLGAMAASDVGRDPRTRAVVYWDAVADGEAIAARWARDGQRDDAGMLWVDGIPHSPELVRDVRQWRGPEGEARPAISVTTHAVWGGQGPDGWLHVPTPMLDEIVAAVHRAAQS